MQVKSIAECSNGIGAFCNTVYLYVTFIKQPFVIKIFVLSIFEWPFFTGLLYVKMCEEYLRSVGGTISLSSLSFRGKGLPYVVMRSISLLSP